MQTIKFDLLDVDAGALVLDMGCGEGRHSIGLYVEREINAMGFDLSVKDLTTARNRIGDFSISETNNSSCVFGAGDIHCLPFKNNSYDAVICSEVLEHIENPVPLLKEINRVLTDGKIFIVGVPGALGYASDSDHKVFYSKEKMIDTITEMGFYTQKTFSMPIDLDWLGKKLRQFCEYGVFIKI